MQAKIQLRSLILFAAVLLLLTNAQPAAAQSDRLQIEYKVSVRNPATRQFHVTTTISNIDQAKLDLSLPTWTPGWYTVENYSKNILRFRITDEQGKIVRHTMSRKQTWNVDTRGLTKIVIDYDYRAAVLALNQAKITNDFAFFTGTELFLQPEGHRADASTVSFELPREWKVVSPLDETADPMTFAAANYDTLVDAPAAMGRFDVTPFEVDKKTQYFVAYPAGKFSAEKSSQFIEMLKKVANTHKAVFGELPYKKYVYYYLFAPAESNASGALEHLNSFVAFAPRGANSTPEGLINTASHEKFHLWNVKRLRPAEMWPYDYSRENETPLLWVSEGFTSYYAALGVYRSGLMNRESFLTRVAGTAASVENTPARAYIPPAEASVSTWVGYDAPTAFGISYYAQGQNLAALLDLSIRNDTAGRKGLDDVMRSLYTDFYKRDKGFTTADMIAIINRLTGKDYGDFFSRYVFWTDVPDYDRIFGYAGLKLDRKVVKEADLGISIRSRSGGLYVSAVEPALAAAGAGLEVGDVIVQIDGRDPGDIDFADYAGKSVALTVRRGGAEAKIMFRVGSRELAAFSLTELPNASPAQVAVRESWLRR